MGFRGPAPRKFLRLPPSQHWKTAFFVKVQSTIMCLKNPFHGITTKVLGDHAARQSLQWWIYKSKISKSWNQALTLAKYASHTNMVGPLIYHPVIMISWAKGLSSKLWILTCVHTVSALLFLLLITQVCNQQLKHKSCVCICHKVLSILGNPWKQQTHNSQYKNVLAQSSLGSLISWKIYWWMHNFTIQSKPHIKIAPVFLILLPDT